MSVTKTKPLMSQLEKLATDIKNCIEQIDDEDVEGARSDLSLIYRDLKGEELE